jgi:hypothetical protein
MQMPKTQLGFGGGVRAGIQPSARSPQGPGLPNGLANLMKSGQMVSAPQIPATTIGASAPRATPTFDLFAAKGYAEGGMVPDQGGAAPQMDPAQLQGQLQQFIQQNPQVVQQVTEAVQEAINAGVLTPQDLQMAVQLAIAASQNPQLYPRLRQLAISRGLADEEELPMQYDQGLVFIVLLAGAAAQNMQAPQGGAQPGAAPVATVPQAQPQAPGLASGGHVPPSASPTDDKSGRADDIPIRVSGGEYVIPKHVVERKGTEFFDKLIGKDQPKA